MLNIKIAFIHLKHQFRTPPSKRIKLSFGNHPIF